MDATVICLIHMQSHGSGEYTTDIHIAMDVPRVWEILESIVQQLPAHGKNWNDDHWARITYILRRKFSATLDA